MICDSKSEAQSEAQDPPITDCPAHKKQSKIPLPGGSCAFPGALKAG